MKALPPGRSGLTLVLINVWGGHVPGPPRGARFQKKVGMQTMRLSVVIADEDNATEDPKCNRSHTSACSQKPWASQRNRAALVWRRPDSVVRYSFGSLEVHERAFSYSKSPENSRRCDPFRR